MKKLLFVSSLLAAIVGWSDPITYTGAAGTKNYRTSLNAQMDSDDTSLYLWSDKEAAHSDGEYYIGKTAFFSGLGTTKFNGNSLEVGNAATVTMNVDQGEAEFTTLTVDGGAKFSANFDWNASTPSVKTLKGTLWEINGTLAFSCQRQYGIFSLDVPVTGSGCVEFGGYVKGTWAGPRGENQRIASDNSAFTGKFLVNLPNTVNQGESCARGVEISAASALGGALDVATPDALTLNSWNGLIAKETLMLNAANRGIDLKANAFFEVASGKTMTIAEPIRSEGGFFKRGAGALALDSAITFGVNGMAEPDGTNSKLIVKEGALRCVSTTATEDLDIVFGDNASLEIDPTTGTKGLVCRSLTFEGVLPVTVDFGSSYVAGAVVTVPLFTVSTAVAQNLIGRIDVRAKGSSMAGTLTLSEPSEGLVTIATTLTVPGETTIKIRNAAVNWNTQINAQKDVEGNFLWSNNLAVQSDRAYSIPFGKYYQMAVAESETQFNGKSLDVSNGAAVDLEVKGSGCEIKSLSVAQNVKFKFKHTWSGTRTLTGDGWTVDGTLRIQPYSDKSTSRFNLQAPLTGSGLVEWMGTVSWTDVGAANQGLFADNGSYHGKFSVNLPLAKTGGADSEHARGIEIDRAESLGGALDVATPDALTLNSWNGLIAKETLTLNAANRGIDLKANAFFEVASGKTMTIAEPIRSEGGFFKRGAGTLALGSADVTLGTDGAAVADGSNNKLQVKAGAIRPTGTAGMGKLTLTFAEGAVLEIDGTTEDADLKQHGLYQPNGMTVAGAALPVKVILEPGTDIKKTLSIPLVTVPAADAEALAAKIRRNVTVEGLARRCALDVIVNPVGNDLACVRLDIVRKGLILVIK